MQEAMVVINALDEDPTTHKQGPITLRSVQA
jgi:hypothetical protein